MSSNEQWQTYEKQSIDCSSNAIVIEANVFVFWFSFFNKERRMNSIWSMPNITFIPMSGIVLENIFTRNQSMRDMSNRYQRKAHSIQLITVRPWYCRLATSIHLSQWTFFSINSTVNSVDGWDFRKENLRKIDWFQRYIRSLRSERI